MKTKTIDCVECGEKVSYGRLSCPACGALLASVAGGPARQVPEPSPVEVDADAPVGVADTADAMPRRTRGRGRRDARVRRRARPDPPSRSMTAQPTGAAETQTPRRPSRPPRATPRSSRPKPRPTPIPRCRRRAGGARARAGSFSLSPEPTEALPAALRTPFDGPEPILIARPYVHRKDVTAATGPGHTPPSAYRPPVLALSTAATAGAGRRGAAPGRPRR